MCVFQLTIAVLWSWLFRDVVQITCSISVNLAEERYLLLVLDMS